MTEPALDLHHRPGDRVAKTTCYMCACRCGIDVHVKRDAQGTDRVAYIEGNRDHPVNRGVLCAKGAAGVMQHAAPSRLRAPLKRVGHRGEGKFEEISWDEALDMAAAILRPIRETDPSKLAFFTGRDQSQSFTSWWAQAFGTPNYAAHGGFCSVNMAAAGIYTVGSAFWEFGQPDWDRTRMFTLFGVAEDHDSNPIKMGIGRLKAQGARVVGVNPVRTGYNAVADDWFGITPGTDGLFVLAVVHCLLEAGRIDLRYLRDFTDAPVLVDARDGPTKGLALRDDDGHALVWCRRERRPRCFDAPDVDPDLNGAWEQDGATHRTVFHAAVHKYLDPAHAPEAVADRCGIPAPRIRAYAAALAHAAFDEAFELDIPWTDFRGRRHETMQGRPVSFHAMRGVSAHANGFQTCRAIHLLQVLLGSVEAPGGFRFKPPYPKPATAHPKPHCRVTPGGPLDGPHLGFVHGPDDLCLRDDGSPARIDKAFSWENPMSAHGMMHMVISNAHAGDPYRIDTLLLYMANMAWNSSMNTTGTMAMLADRKPDGSYVIPHVIYADAYSSETVAYADLVLPDTTYLERHDCISLLDRPICEADAAADAVRIPVVEPDRDVVPFQTAMLRLGAKLGLPGMVRDDGSPRYADFADYMVRHERRPGVGPLMGWRGEDGTETGRGAPNPAQLDRYRENGGFCTAHVPDGARFMKPWNRAYQDWAVEMGLYDAPQPYLVTLWCEPLRRFQLAAEGHGDRQPPDHLRDRIRRRFDPLPIWWDPTEDHDGDGAYTLSALTQRPMAMYHSWGSQNAWTRQIHGRNPLYLPTAVWTDGGFRDGDWARVRSPHGEIVVPVAHMPALNPRTVWTWNAIGKRRGAWALGDDAPEHREGFLLNHLIHELMPPRGDGLRWSNSDPITGQAAWFDLKVSVERCAAPADRRSRPHPAAQASPVGTGPATVAWEVGP